MVVKLKRVIKLLRIKSKVKKVYFAKNANFSIRSSFEGQNKIGANTWLDGYIGYGSYLGDGCVISAKIGRFCSIGHNVRVLTGTHPSHKYVSTNPVFYSLELQNGTTYVYNQKYAEKKYADEEHEYGAIIGNDVWIGYNAVVMGGVKIGDGAIIAAGALVNKDVEPYTIVAGVPSRVVGQRFTTDQISWLMNFRWWERPISWIKEHAEDFDDIEEFIQKYQKCNEEVK